MCVFCKIINNEIPSDKVYEDDKTLAFLDIAPVTAGHVLVIPKKHYENISDIPEEELGDLMRTVKRIAVMLEDKLGIFDCNVNENNGALAGQVVPHLHFHVIPRRSDDGLKLWPGHSYQNGEKEELLKKLLS